MATGLYVQLDVNYADDPKIAAVSTEAELLYIRALCFAKRLLSDGYIARVQLYRLASDIATDEYGGSEPENLAKELVHKGLWRDSEDGSGWIISAWHKHNASAEEVEEKRAAKRFGGELGNHRRWHKDKRSDDCRYCESVDRSDSESTETEEETEEEEETGTSSSEETSDPVETYGQTAVDLTRQLAKRVEANGHKIPGKSTRKAERWFDAIEKLLRIDGADPDEVRRVIDWCTEDEFWRANIQSAGKFREKYTQLRLKSLSQTNGQARASPRVNQVSEFTESGKVKP